MPCGLTQPPYTWYTRFATSCSLLRPLAPVRAPAPPCSNIVPYHRRLAEIIEMIHTASLVHDDVLDDCSVRRGKCTFPGAVDLPSYCSFMADFCGTPVVKSAPFRQMPSTAQRSSCSCQQNPASCSTCTLLSTTMAVQSRSAEVLCAPAKRKAELQRVQWQHGLARCMSVVLHTPFMWLVFPCAHSAHDLCCMLEP